MNIILKKSKYFRYIIIVMLFTSVFLISNCRKSVTFIKVLTDDINLFETAASFNTQHNDIKIVIDYFDVDKNIFQYFNANKINNYDIIAGKTPYDNIINLNKMKRLDKYINNLLLNPDNYYSAISEYLQLHNHALALYSIDFPVMIINKNIINAEDNEPALSISRFIQLNQAANYFKNDGRKNPIQIAFSPRLSYYNVLDYYFIFHDQKNQNENYFSFNKSIAEKAFNFYFEYDNQNNYGSQMTKDYIEKYSHLNKNQFLDHQIIYSDFTPLSLAFQQNRDNFKLLLIKSLQFISLQQKVVCISEKSFNPKKAGVFIDYLYDSQTQMSLSKNSLTYLDLFQSFHLPIVKKDLSELEDPFFTNKQLEEYIDQLKIINFQNAETNKKIFESYQQTKMKLDSGEIDEKNFLFYFSQNIKE